MQSLKGNDFSCNEELQEIRQMTSTVRYRPQNMIVLEKDLSRQESVPLLEAMKKYRDKKCTPFDVPGHKYGRGLPELSDYFGEDALAYDFNSMKPLDILSNPTSVIMEAESLLAEAYGADSGFFVVNGTSSAVKSMIMAACRPNDKILVPRNAHKSVLNGLIGSGAIPIYLQPEFDLELGMFHGVNTEYVKTMIDKNLNAKAILLINPTYYGAVSQLKEIAKYAHSKNMVVLVDEAHGAHLSFHGDLPPSGIECGADMVAISMHKTGGSLTQSSALLSRNERVKPQLIRKYLNLNGTTSASYLLMGSLDAARRNLAINGYEAVNRAIEIARYGRNKINEIEGLYALGSELIGKRGVYGFDETKLVINTKGIGLTGFELYDTLRDRYNIQVELGDTYNLLAIVSLGDTYESMEVLIEALKDIGNNKRRIPQQITHPKNVGTLEVAMCPREAFYAETEKVLFKQSVGRISGESIMAYPPGIPIVTPGEVITEEVVKYALHLKKNKALITDIQDISLRFIDVIK